MSSPLAPTDADTLVIQAKTDIPSLNLSASGPWAIGGVGSDADLLSKPTLEKEGSRLTASSLWGIGAWVQEFSLEASKTPGLLYEALGGGRSASTLIWRGGQEGLENKRNGGEDIPMRCLPPSGTTW